MILNNGTLKKTMALLPEQIDQFGGQRAGEKVRDSWWPASLVRGGAHNHNTLQ